MVIRKMPKAGNIRERSNGIRKWRNEYLNEWQGVGKKGSNSKEKNCRMRHKRFIFFYIIWIVTADFVYLLLLCIQRHIFISDKFAVIFCLKIFEIFFFYNIFIPKFYFGNVLSCWCYFGHFRRYLFV
jgi:hypothetical protein